MTEQTYQKLVEDIRRHPKDWMLLIVNAVGFDTVEDIVDDIEDELYPGEITYINSSPSVYYDDGEHPITLCHPGTTTVVNVASGGTYNQSNTYEVNVSIDNSEHTEYHRSTNIGVGDNVIERFGNTIDNIIGNAVGNFFKKL